MSDNLLKCANFLFTIHNTHMFINVQLINEKNMTIFYNLNMSIRVLL
jgi:hypothetical protein